jgi:hypothetical protein
MYVLQTRITKCEISLASGCQSCVTEITLTFFYQYIVVKLRLTTINVCSTGEFLSLYVTGVWKSNFLWILLQKRQSRTADPEGMQQYTTTRLTHDTGYSRLMYASCTNKGNNVAEPGINFSKTWIIGLNLHSISLFRFIKMCLVESHC